MRWFRKSRDLNPRKVPAKLHPFIDLVERYGSTDYEGKDSLRIFQELKGRRSELDEIERRLADWRAPEEMEFRNWEHSGVNQEEFDRFNMFFALMDGFDIRPEEPVKDAVQKAIEELQTESRDKKKTSIVRYHAAKALQHYGEFGVPALPALHAALDDPRPSTVSACRVAIAQITHTFDEQLEKIRELLKVAQRDAIGTEQLETEIIMDQIEADIEWLECDATQRDAFALGVVVRAGHLSRLKQLLERCTVERLDHDGRPPIVNAAMSRATSALKYLLEAGANPNNRWKNDMSALHVAVSGRNNQNIIKLLVEHGADASLKNQNGQTAADLARDIGYSEYLPLLDPKGTTDA